MRRSTKLLCAVGLACVVAAGGSAFTAALTPPAAPKDYEVGFVSRSLSGGSIVSLHYTLDADGTHITNVTAVMSGDTSNRVLSVGFTNGGAATDSVDCATGSYNGGTTQTTYLCDLTVADAAGHAIVAADRVTGTVDHVNVALH
jgi:hypothetical protein